MFFAALTMLAPRAPAPACIVMSGKADPLRPQRPPLEPMIINAIQDLLRGKEPGAVVERAVQGRRADPDYELADSEQRLMEQRILQVGRALVPLHGALEQVVADTPWIDQYGMGADLGMGDVANPYVRACRAECMLAVLMLHLERVEVNFIDSDRLEVLRDAPSSASLRAVRAAVVEPADGQE